MADAVHNVSTDRILPSAPMTPFSHSLQQQPLPSQTPNSSSIPKQLQCNHACPYHCAAFHANMNNAYIHAPPPPNSIYYPYYSSVPSDFSSYSYSTIPRTANHTPTNIPNTTSHTVLHSRTKRRGHGVVSIGDMLDRLQLFFQARLRNFSKNRACAEIEISKGTVNTYQERVNEANKYGINLEEFRDYKRDFKQVFRTTVLQSGEFSSLKKNSTADGSAGNTTTSDAQGNNAGSSTISNNNASQASESLLDIDIPPSIANKELIHKIMPKLKLALEPVRILNSEDGHTAAQHAHVSSTVIDGAVHTHFTGGFHDPPSNIHLKRKRPLRHPKQRPQSNSNSNGSVSKTHNSNDNDEEEEDAVSNEDVESDESAVDGASDAEIDAEEDEGESGHIAHIMALQSAANTAATTEIDGVAPAKSNSAPVTTTIPISNDVASSLNDLKTVTPIQSLPMTEKNSKRVSSPSTDSKTTRSDSRLAVNSTSSLSNSTPLGKRSSSSVDATELVGTANTIPLSNTHAIGMKDGISTFTGSNDSVSVPSPMSVGMVDSLAERKKQKLATMDPHPLNTYYTPIAPLVPQQPPSHMTSTIPPAPNPYYSMSPHPATLPPHPSMHPPSSLSPATMPPGTSHHPLQNTIVPPPHPFHHSVPSYHSNPHAPPQPVGYSPYPTHHHSNSAPNMNHPYYNQPPNSSLASSHSAPPIAGATAAPPSLPPLQQHNVNPYMYAPSAPNPINSNLTPPPQQSMMQQPLPNVYSTHTHTFTGGLPPILPLLPVGGPLRPRGIDGSVKVESAFVSPPQ